MRGNLGCGALIVIAGLLVALVGFWGWHVEYGTETNVTFTVNSIQDQANGSTGHKYLLFTTRSDGKNEVFENTDTILHGKTDSSDVQARFLQAGNGATWRCPVFGFRLFFGSHYRDILDGCTLLHTVGTAPGNFYPTPNGHPPVNQQYVTP